MCGIVAVANLDRTAASPATLRGMTEAVKHRGPDGEGEYLNGFVALGHRRLAIIDLSPAGHQPISNESGDVILTYNGELFNFQTLRVELEAKGHRFHSKTDSEVVAHAYEEWGPDCVLRFNGQFAFVILDKANRKLFAARDRFGVKPLYYGQFGDSLIFASEIKSILQHPDAKARICFPALAQYLTFQNTFGDLTLFEGIRLMPPASRTLIDLDRPGDLRIETYWDYDFSQAEIKASEEEAADELYRLFVQAVSRQLVSDAPIGSYLSGGMDSGSITAIAARSLPRLATFTCGFDLSSATGMELSFDERPVAEAMANWLKTEHYEVVLHAGDMEHVLPDLIWYQEDLRVGQCYPNYYVARLASKFVKVVLAGTGGDELFGGYPWRYYRSAGCANRDEFYSRYYDFWQRLVPDDHRTSLFNEATLRDIGSAQPFDAFRSVFDGYKGELICPEDFINASLYFELKTFLPGLLVVEDKLSMAHSLETRVPFLDNDLVDFALRVPVRYKLSNLDQAIQMDENVPWKRRATADGKAVLRSAMSRIIPKEVTERNKQGFSAPDASWFRGESIDYINRLLRSPRARIYDLLQPAYVESALDQHTSGQANRRLFIWSLLSLEHWLRRFVP
ncbi:MAG: asparagine synthase (glutamine-hydrolyzing) [Armatimonadetes bacterium]|nr:asparagine synthase (glutamine-hydrolyzing) [Armatimonadota bacterium]